LHFWAGALGALTPYGSRITKLLGISEACGLAPGPRSPLETSTMIAIYAPMFLMLLAAGLLAFAFWGLDTFLGRHKQPTPDKNAPFECGSESTGARDVKLSVKFYLTAILFVVFDIESVFVYPWAVQFHGLGWFGLIEMLGFLAVIVVALAYVWRKGALEWET
jgi:NADH-quinone oxidoreductase subunit A